MPETCSVDIEEKRILSSRACKLLTQHLTLRSSPYFIFFRRYRFEERRIAQDNINVSIALADSEVKDILLF